MTSFEPDAQLSSWPIVRRWLEDACEECDGWWTINALEDLLSGGRAILWVLTHDGIPTGAVVTAVCDWDGKKVAEIVIAGGMGILDGLTAHFGKVHEWARSHQVPEIMFRGRRGWARALKSFGYEEIAVTLRKAL